MITVVCWKWNPAPGYRTKFTAQHVNALYEMIKKHLTLPFRFSCITDDPEGIDENIRIIKLWKDLENLKNPTKKNGPSCYRRLKAFSAEAKDIIGDRIFSLDLDTIIVGNIDSIVDREEDFVCYGGTATNTFYNGGMFLLKAGSRTEVWDTFTPIQSPKLTKASRIVGSDQGWISYVLKGKDPIWTEKDGVYSFRNYFDKSPGKPLPKNAKIISFHGGIDPWSKDLAKRYPWIDEYYLKELREGKVVERQKLPSVNKEIDCITFLWGKEPYNYVYVNKLFNMIDRHLSYKHRNICFTNIPEGIREDVIIKPLHNEWMKHNLKKMIQYDPENGLKGRVLSFDLDMVILKSLDMYAEYTDEFCICEAVNPQRKGKCGGNFMAFNAGYGVETIWKPLSENYDYYAKETEGFERFLYDMLIDKMTFWPQETIVSYKKHVRKNKVKDWDKVHMIWGHGKPQLTEIKDKIVVDNWK